MWRAPRRPLPGLLLLAALAGCDATEPGPPADDIPAFEARLEKLRRTLDIPGMSAAIARDGSVIWSRGFGYADVEKGVPATPETAFHLASLTKTYASTIVMQLVEEGRLGLEDPVSRYGIVLGSPGTVRVKHLLTHTSEGVPGDGFRYNGDRFALLDGVIVGASGRRFGELLVERILRPLQLSRTAPNVQDAASFGLTGYDRAQFEQGLAQGYDSDGRTRRAYPASFSTAAGLISTATEVARYSLAIEEGRFVSAETQARIFTPATGNGGQRLPYGLGWFVQDHRGVRLVWHYGYWTANSSLIVKVPEQRLTFVILANSDMLSRPYGLGGDENVLRSAVARAFVEAFVRLD